MKIAHVTEYCHAGSTGGTERYLLDLATELTRRGHENEILWLTTRPSGSSAKDKGVSIRELPRGEMRVDDPPADLCRRVREEVFGAAPPDILHFHTFGRSEAVLADLAVEHRIPYAFTCHSPAWTCRRETMLLWGDRPCDGEVRTLRCSACKAQERTGGPAWLGYAGAAASFLAGPLVSSAPGLWHRRLAFTTDTARFRADLRRFLASCGLVVACAEWSLPVLRANGARPVALVHLPQGIPAHFEEPRVARPEDSFTVGYVGRMDETKGIHILVEGFRKTASAKARLKVYGWDDAATLRDYGRRLRRLAGDDTRIQFIAGKKPEDMPAEYAGLSLLAVPSVSLETGPLTLLEALQAGVPVFGTNRLGQRSLLEKYGRVIEPNTPEAWARALEEAFQAHARGVWRPVKLEAPLPTMGAVAERMAEHYERAIQPQA